MVQTWGKRAGDDATCQKCGATYSVIHRRIPQKDKDQFNCVVCGHLMDSWNDTQYPEYTLIAPSAE